MSGLDPMAWDDPRTVRYYESFCKRHDRYRVANDALVAHARLAPGQRVLDVAAGTGRTSEVALPFLGESGRVVCVEPAAAMRKVGAARLRGDPRVTWVATPPHRKLASFDRVLCGAAIWQMRPLEATLRELAALVRPGGALVFNVPSLYLREPDEPGGGRDPWLVELPAVLAEGHAPSEAPAALEPLPDAVGVDALVAAAGLRPERWEVRSRLTQKAYRDWLKIPVTTEVLLAGLDPDERARRIDRACRRVDAGSWRWERWTGWSAWKP